jgi:hypothetical protein
MVTQFSCVDKRIPAGMCLILSKAGNSNHFPTLQAQAQLERLWTSLAHEPAQQALECAAYCLEHAPHLAEWLKARILSGISDSDLIAMIRPPVTDGRILAYNQLCTLPALSPVEKGGGSSSEPKQPGTPKRRLNSFQANYQAIFGVTPTVLPEVSAELRVEPEIGRICIGLDKASEYRIYIIARELTRSADGSGKVAKKALRAVLESYGIEHTRRHVNRLLRAGEGIFWNLGKTSIYIRSYTFVSMKLHQLAPELFSTNKPGVRDMYLSPCGTHEQWEAMLYAAWLAHRNNPTIARTTLESLFNRSADTLRRWEETRLRRIVSVRANDVQAPHPLHEDDRYADHIPEHSTPYVAQVKFQGQLQQVIRIRWRTSNTYQVSNIRQHPKRGQAKKVRKAVNHTSELPAENKRGGMQRLNKMYFDNAKHLKVYTAKYHTIGYLWRGEARWGRGVFEINNIGFWLTYANERVQPGVERGVLSCL